MQFELKKRIAMLEKENMELASQNVELKEQLRSYEQPSCVPYDLEGLNSRTGEMKEREVEHQLERLGIEESVENFVKNFRQKYKDLDVLTSKYKELEESHASLLEEKKKLTKELEHQKNLNAKSIKLSKYNIFLTEQIKQLKKEKKVLGIKNEKLENKLEHFESFVKDNTDGASMVEVKKIAKEVCIILSSDVMSVQIFF